MFRLQWIRFIFLILAFTSCKSVQHQTNTEVNYFSLDEAEESDESILAIISPYKEEMEKAMDIAIGDLDQKLVKDKPNSNMGNWFADILLEEANNLFSRPVDIAVQNYGGLRLPYVAAGPLTIGKIYELMPFDNTLVVLDMQKDELINFLNGIAIYGGWPISKSLEFEIGEQGAENIKVAKATLQDDKIYRVAMPDYVANGGDGNDLLPSIPHEDSGLFIRDVVIDNLKKKLQKGEAIIVDSAKRIH